jgi:CheY-like chemotaxis protein
MELPSPVVLIAEDDTAIGELLRDCLESEGYTVVRACEGSQVIAQLHKARVDLLLLDV